MSDSDSSDSESEFHPFTRDSLAAIEKRIAVEKAKKKLQQQQQQQQPQPQPQPQPQQQQQQQHLQEDLQEDLQGQDEQEAEEDKNYSSSSSSEDDDPDINLEAEMPLPIYMQNNFPKELYTTPIEDIDKFYRNKRTFVVIGKRNEIFRFSATKAMWIFDPFNPLRRLTIYLLVNPIFNTVVIVTIVINCIFMTQNKSEIADDFEPFFIAIYSFEAIIKIVARGFILQKFTYLRDFWNGFDLVIIILAYVSLFFRDVEELTILRPYRVLRALKTVSIVSGLKPIVNAVVESVRNLRDVVILTLSFLASFALLGMQIYMGSLRQKCVITLSEENLWTMTEVQVDEFRNNASNWYYREGEPEPLVCGNNTGGTSCPDGYTCYEKYGQNPNYGYTSFDNFGWALLSAFRLMTLDFWEELYHMILRALGPWCMLFFTFNIFICSFFLMNLILTIVSASYDDLQKRAMLEEQEEQKMFRTIEEEVHRTAKGRKRKGSRRASHSIIYNNGGFFDEPEITAHGSDKPLDKESSFNSKDFLSVPKNPFIDQSSTNPVFDKKDAMALNSIIELAAHDHSHTRKLKDGKEVENPKWKEKVLAQSLQCVEIFCVWHCCKCWVRFQDHLCMIVYDAFFELFISLCIVVNIVFMALDRPDLSPEMEHMLLQGNYVFTAIFAIEAALKILANSPKNYFKDSWNRFDFIIVVLGLVELNSEGVMGLAVLRPFRLLRVFKLARSWPTLNMLISIISKTTGALSNLTFVLAIIIFVYAVIGLQLFGDNYVDRKYRLHDKRVPRWNFVDFFHSFMIVFRVLCGEWIESMWDCLQVNNMTCLPFFVTTFLIGNLVIFNLFFALLLNSFESSKLTAIPDDNETIVAINRFKSFVAWLIRLCRTAINIIRCKTSNRIADQTNRTNGHNGAEKGRLAGETLVNGKKKHSVWTVALNDAVEISTEGDVMKNIDKKDMPNSERVYSSVKRIDNKNKEELDDSLSSNGMPSRRSSVASAVVGGEKKKDIKKDEDEVDEGQKSVEQDVKVEVEEPKVPFICCMDCCYRNIPCCAGKETPFWNSWYNFRLKMLSLIDNTCIEALVSICILVSCIALTMEDKYITENKVLGDVLNYLDIVFTVLFFIEMLIKWIALGYRKYFTDSWCCLEFIIVLVTILYFGAYLFGAGNILCFKFMRTLRSLRALRLLPIGEAMRLVVNSCVQAIPSILNVLLVCLTIWLMFSIIGVQLFGGKYYKCRTLEGEPVNLSGMWKEHLKLDYTTDISVGKNECLKLNMTWDNSKINFDNVANGYLALFQVVTFEGWIEVMADATDSTEQYLQPEYEANVYMYLFFVAFIIVGSFFILNLFTGVIVDNFKLRNRKTWHSYMTAVQQGYENSIKEMSKKKLNKAIPRPKFRPQAIIYDFIEDERFGIMISLFIVFNLIIMALEHYQMTKTFKQYQTAMSIVFVAIFSTECLLKIFAYRLHYFKQGSNLFDFVIVILSILGIVFEDWFHKYFISPPLLRALKMARLLRLVKRGKGLGTLFFSLIITLPTLFCLSYFLFIVNYIYAIIGMSFFKNVTSNGLDETFNFGTFIKSMILLFQLQTSAGWNDILEALMNEENCTPPNPDTEEEGDCGNGPVAIAYLVSYLVITFLIILNMFIAAILDNYDRTVELVQGGLTDSDYDMALKVWQKFDPNGIGYIRYSDLTHLLAELEVPLKIAQPNKYKIVNMDIPICMGDRFYYVDVLNAVMKDFYTRKGSVLEESIGDVSKADRPGYVVISSTLRRQREEFSARVIQKAWRQHHSKAQEQESNLSAVATDETEPQV